MPSSCDIERQKYGHELEKVSAKANTFFKFYQPSFVWLILMPGPIVLAITQLLMY